MTTTCAVHTLGPILNVLFNLANGYVFTECMLTDNAIVAKFLN